MNLFVVEKLKYNAKLLNCENKFQIWKKKLGLNKLLRKRFKIFKWYENY